MGLLVCGSRFGIDPLLEQGDRAFAALPDSDAAAAIVAGLAALLHSHLAREEAHVVPFLREAKAFPPPATDAEAKPPGYLPFPRAAKAR